MEKVYARLIIKGVKTMDDVPESLRKSVSQAIEDILRKEKDNE